MSAEQKVITEYVDETGENDFAVFINVSVHIIKGDEQRHKLIDVAAKCPI